MPLQKNQVLTLTIERLSNDGSGVAHSPDGEAVFIPGTAPGDVAAIRIVKDCGRYAFGILDAIQTPSPDRIPVDCAVAGPCGGCSLRHLDYAAELRAKGESVTDAFRRIGGLDVPVLPPLPLPPRSTATAIRFNSRWAVIRMASPASVSTPGAPTALYPAPTASCSRMC